MQRRNLEQRVGRLEEQAGSVRLMRRRLLATGLDAATVDRIVTKASSHFSPVALNLPGSVAAKLTDEQLALVWSRGVTDDLLRAGDYYILAYDPASGDCFRMSDLSDEQAERLANGEDPAEVLRDFFE